VGTPGSTVNLTPSGSFIEFPTLLTPAGTTLYFQAVSNASGYGLWRTNGTVGDRTQLSVGNLGEICAFGTGVYFSMQDGAHGLELWKSDGTVAGTGLVADLQVGAGSSWPQGLTRAGQTLSFSAEDGLSGRELWALTP